MLTGSPCQVQIVGNQRNTATREPVMEEEEDDADNKQFAICRLIDSLVSGRGLSRADDDQLDEVLMDEKRSNCQWASVERSVVCELKSYL